MTTTKPKSPPSLPGHWRLEEAKARFSQVVEEAMRGQPQHVTRRGKPAVVVVSAAEWEARAGKGPSAWDLLRNAPKLTDEEHAAFEKALKRGEQVADYREVDFD